MAASTPMISRAADLERMLDEMHWPDYSPIPDLACDQCWGTHCIFEAVITSIDKNSRIPVVSFDVVRTFSDPPDKQISPTVQSNFQSKDQPSADLVSLALGERLVVFCLRGKSSGLFVERIASDREAPPLVSRLIAISRLRSLRSSQPAFLAALRASAFDPDPTVSEYCLRQMLEHDGLSAETLDASRFRKLADVLSAETKVRILAAQIAFTVETGRPYSEEEYEWLWRSFRGAPRNALMDLALFTKRIVEFPLKRHEKIQRVLDTAGSGALDLPIRSAACHALTEKSVFGFKHPDEWSDRIFQSTLQLLRDPEKRMRSTAADCAVVIVNRWLYQHQREPDDRAYLARAINAVKEAFVCETDERTKGDLGWDLETLERFAAPARPSAKRASPWPERIPGATLIHTEPLGTSMPK